MMYFGFGMGMLLMVIGWATYYFAPRVGPNPFFGVRIGYAYANRETWDKTNRFGGIVIAAIGLFIALLGLILPMLNIAANTGISILTGVMLVALLGSVVVMFFYARNLARGMPIVRELAPVKFRWAYLAPVLISFVLLVALMAYFYPALPAEKMATHFGIDDQPNDWMARDSFVIFYLGLAAMFIALDVFVVLLATREPMIAFGRLGTSWRLDPERGLIFVGIVFALTNGIMMLALWSTAWYNIYGVHAFPLPFLLWIIIPFIAIIVALFFWLSKREK